MSHETEGGPLADLARNASQSCIPGGRETFLNAIRPRVQSGRQAIPAHGKTADLAARRLLATLPGLVLRQRSRLMTFCWAWLAWASIAVEAWLRICALAICVVSVE